MIVLFSKIFITFYVQLFMESVIKWRTGEPTGRHGKFIITYKYFQASEYSTKYITTAIREGNTWYDINYDRLRVDVIAWCPLNEIEPYKE